MAAKKWPKGQHRKQSSSNEQPSVQPSVKGAKRKDTKRQPNKQHTKKYSLLVQIWWTAGAGLVTPQNSQALDLEDPASSFHVSTVSGLKSIVQSRWPDRLRSEASNPALELLTCWLLPFCLLSANELEDEHDRHFKELCLIYLDELQGATPKKRTRRTRRTGRPTTTMTDRQKLQYSRPHKD